MKKFVELYLDESGSLPDPAEHFAVAALINFSGKNVGKIPRKVFRAIHKKEGKCLRGKELKFSNTTDRIRQKILKLLVKGNIEIFILVIKKEKRKIADTPKNYGEIISLLIQDCNYYYPCIKLVMDIHFTRRKEGDELEKTLYKKIPRDSLKIETQDSQKEKLIQLADFVAGAFYWKYEHDNNRYAKILDDKIKVEKVILWKRK